MSIPRYAAWALALAAMSLSSHASDALAASGCRVDARSTVRANAACRHGLPVRVGKLLLLPKACRIPMGKKAVLRHAVEIRDGSSGKKLGQASLPSRPAAANAPVPAVGAVLAGPFPLYVFAGGVGAVDAAARRAELVFEPTGKLAALARHGEILSLVDALPADATFPKGSLEWTVLDFGKGELLGQARLAGSRVDGAGFAARADGLHATIDGVARKGPVTLWAHLRDAAGKTKTGKGLLRPVVKARAKGPAAKAKPAGAGSCPVAAGATSIRTDSPPLSILGGEKMAPTRRSTARLKIGSKSSCLVATPPDKTGRSWAWLRTARGAALHGLDCSTKTKKK